MVYLTFQELVLRDVFGVKKKLAPDRESSRFLGKWPGLEVSPRTEGVESKLLFFSGICSIFCPIAQCQLIGPGWRHSTPDSMVGVLSNCHCRWAGTKPCPSHLPSSPPGRTQLARLAHACMAVAHITWGLVCQNIPPSLPSKGRLAEG